MAVVGLGYVGFPAAVSFAQAGVKVHGVDVNRSKVESINRGVCPSEEEKVCESFAEAWDRGLIEATVDYGVISEVDAVIFALPTPVQEGRADLSILENAVAKASRVAPEGVLFSIESTVPPGTTRRLARLVEEESRRRLVLDETLYVVHVPERIAPGKSIEEMTSIPRIVGGVSTASTKAGLELYSMVNRNLVPATAEEAELAKLAENTYRDLNIAFANFLALTAERIGVDAWKVIRAANTHPRVNIHLPGAGVGGPCLTKDPYMLATVGSPLPGVEIITIARRVNDYMPDHMVSLVQRALREAGLNARDAKIAVLGAAYKGGVGDTRESPSRRIVELLLGMGVDVVVHDPYVRESFGARFVEDVYEAARGADALVIVTDHPEYRRLDWAGLARVMRRRIIVDGRRVIEPEDAVSTGFRYYGVGFLPG